MTKQQENRAFVKMIKEFPKAFGRVSFRERLMLRTAFTYVVEEVIADIKANCDLAIEGRDIKIMELERKLEQTEKDLADYQFNYPTIKELEKENTELKRDKEDLIFVRNAKADHICELKEQLTKAKDLLKGWLGDFYNPKAFHQQIAELVEQSEQFMKEIEKC